MPFYCFHDVDVSPEGASLKEYINNFAQMVDVPAGKQEESGVKLLWGTANCFTNPRYGAGAATNPDPEVFSWAATQVVTAMEATHKLGGENYVLWGGREGYETLLNTDLRRSVNSWAALCRWWLSINIKSVSVARCLSNRNRKNRPNINMITMLRRSMAS